MTSRIFCLRYRILIAAILILAASAGGYAQSTESLLSQADRLYYSDRLDEGDILLERELADADSNAARSEILWCQARNANRRGYFSERSDDEDGALTWYTRGRELGEAAIKADPGNAMAYFWTSVNVGTESRINGIMDSLQNAEPMRDLLIESCELDPDLPDAYFVLGQLYEQVPGFVYGDDSWAVSFGRLSIELHDLELASGADIPYRYDFVIHLARHLWDRNWSLRKRNREIPDIARSFSGEDAAFDRNKYYEGATNIPNLSDREEALELIAGVLAAIGNIDDADLSINETDYLTEAKALMKKWD